MQNLQYFSQACDNNKTAILQHLTHYFCRASDILEVGSGTGQHATYFASQLPHLLWQPSDLRENHEAIQYWITRHPSKNLLTPIEFDVESKWPDVSYTGIFTANTLHIMSIEQVEILFQNLHNILNQAGYFLVYGPFNHNGKYTSESNEQFDQYLRNRHSKMGIRNDDFIIDLAHANQLKFIEDNPMPANNRLLCFQKL